MTSSMANRNHLHWGGGLVLLFLFTFSIGHCHGFGMYIPPTVELPQWPPNADDTCNWTVWDACQVAHQNDTIVEGGDNVCEICDKEAIAAGMNCAVTRSIVKFIAPQFVYSYKPILYQRSTRISALENLDKYAAECKIKMLVTSSWREYGKRVAGAIVQAAKRSRHMTGHAIDVNFIFQRSGAMCKESNGCLSSTAHWLNKKNNKYHQHWDKKKMDCPDPVCKCFVDKVRADPEWRWGGDFNTPDMVHVASNDPVTDAEMAQVHRSIEFDCMGTYTKAGSTVSPPKTVTVTYTPPPSPPPNNTDTDECVDEDRRRSRRQRRQNNNNCVDASSTNIFTNELGNNRRELTCPELASLGMCYDMLAGDDIVRLCPVSCGSEWTCTGDFTASETSDGGNVCEPEPETSNPFGLPSTCLSPQPKTCNFYQDCLETVSTCGTTGYALQYGKTFCDKFINPQLYGQFNAAGKKWVDGTLGCLQKSIIKGGALETRMGCDDIRSMAFNSHESCFVRNNFCQIIDPSRGPGLRDNLKNLNALHGIFSSSSESWQQICHAVLKCVSSEWFTFEAIANEYNNVCGNPTDATNFQTFSIFPNGARVNQMPSSASPWGAYDANEYNDPFDEDYVVPAIDASFAPGDPVPERIIGHNLVVADFMSKHVFNGANQSQSMITFTHPLTGETMKRNKFFRLDYRIVECADRLQKHSSEGDTISILEGFRTRNEAYIRWKANPTMESYPSRLQTGAAIRVELTKSTGEAPTASDYHHLARNAVLECYPIFAEFGRAIGIGLGPSFVQVDLRERVIPLDAADALKSSQGYRAWVYPGAALTAPKWDAEVWTLIRANPIERPPSGIQPPERQSPDYVRLPTSQFRRKRREVFNEAIEASRRKRRSIMIDSNSGVDFFSDTLQQWSNVSIQLTEHDAASEQLYGIVYTYNPNIFDAEERRLAAVNMTKAMRDVHDERLERNRRTECRDSMFTGLMYATEEGLHNNELTCAELKSLGKCTNGDEAEQVQSLCPKSCELCGTSNEVKKSFCWEAIYAKPGMSEAYGELYASISKIYQSGHFDNIPHKPWVDLPSGTGGGAGALFDARQQRDDVENAMFQCFFSCDPVGNWFEQLASRLKDLLGDESHESVMKRKERHCDNFLHWVLPDPSNWGELNNSVHLASFTNSQMQENAIFWGQAVSEVPLYNLIIPAFQRTFLDSDGDIQDIHDETHNPTPIYKVFDELYAMSAIGKVTVWTQHAVELRAMRKIFMILIGYNEKVTSVEVRVPKDALAEAQIALNDLIEGFQDSLYKTKRALLTPVTWKALGDISRKGSVIYGQNGNSTRG